MRRVRTRIVVIAAAALALFAGNVPAASAGTWTLQDPTPPPAADDPGFLLGVDCPTLTACVTVGSTAPPGSPRELAAKHWDGGTWVPKPVAYPAGGYDGELDGVDCVPGGQCMAVGRAEVGSTFRGVITKFDGIAWESRLSPMLRGAEDSWLFDVSCQGDTVLTSCMAVGLYTNPVTRPHALTWTPGEGWRAVKAPMPAGAVSGSFYSVSCAEPKVCMAVGVYNPTGGGSQQAWSAVWDGGVWTQRTVPLRADASASELHDVSCASARYCVAVGWSTLAAGATEVTLAQHWNGAAWVSKPTPALGTRSILVGVSCPSKSSCVAVGNGDTGSASPVFGPLIQRWSDQTWSTESPAAGTPADSTLYKVSCNGKIRCTAVGWSGPDFSAIQPMIQRYA